MPVVYCRIVSTVNVVRLREMNHADYLSYCPCRLLSGQYKIVSNDCDLCCTPALIAVEQRHSVESVIYTRTLSVRPCVSSYLSHQKSYVPEYLFNTYCGPT